MSSYFNRDDKHHHSGGHGHDDHGHSHISEEEAKAASSIVNAGLIGVQRARTGTYRVTPVFRVLTQKLARDNLEFWTGAEIKKEVLQCAKELNRFRYCEDNYSAETKNPAESVTDEGFACTEEQWQATECLTGESPEEAADIMAFTRDADNAGQLLRRLSSHIQIPREWKEVVDEVDPSGLTRPVDNPLHLPIQNDQSEKLINSILKTIFPQEMMDYQRTCGRRYDPKQCARAENLLSQSWVALQLSRYNAQRQKPNFSDVDVQKGNKIRRWKKANIIGGDRSLRRIEVHPADHWISTLSRRGTKYDWFPEISAAIQKSLNEAREQEPQSEEGDQQ
eukprot:TRINITY_DN477_c0_g2_i2.p1 TRINITY_DN477_c0_g2~~TRINITY_DN477_c0_g2_i2.p1  ORF type:complete len:356 (-),score=73.11 TRINITY_DN477_c0_g2_i2:1185-2192(-)